MHIRPRSLPFYLLAPVLTCPIAVRAQTVRTENFSLAVAGKSMRGQLVRIPERGFRFRVGIARDKVGATEPLNAMARRTGAVVAINGSYFQAYNRGPFKPPVMNLIAEGTFFYQGRIGTMTGFTPDNRIVMTRSTEAIASWVATHAAVKSKSSKAPTPPPSIWAEVTNAVGCGPRLLDTGQIVLDARAEGFNDPKVLRLSTARSALGVTPRGEVLLVVSAGTLTQMAALMKQLGCRDAMNLDGGASSGLWLKGRYLRPPGRDLSNALLVVPVQ